MVCLCKVEEDDMDLLYRWANDPVVRNNSFNTETISYENHVKWFRKMVKDPSVLQFILKDDDMPVGQIRLNIVGENAEIGYSIGNEFRGKGYGHIILQLIAQEVQVNYPEIKKLVARVKPENAVSNSLFKTEGYCLEYMSYTLNVQNENE